MSFTYVLTTDIGKVRLKLSDTQSTAYAFEDAEIQVFLDEGGSVDKATALGLRTLLVDVARRTRAYSVPGLTYNDSARVAALKEALAMYGGEMPTLQTSAPAKRPFDAGYTNPLTGT